MPAQNRVPLQPKMSPRVNDSPFGALPELTLNSQPKVEQSTTGNPCPSISYFTVAGGEAYRKKNPQTEIHILDAGHFALDEQPKEIIRLIESFLQKQQL